MAETTALPFTTGDALRRARLNAELSVEDVASRLHVSYATVLRWERDQKMPSGKNLLAFMRLTGADWLAAALMDSGLRSSCSDGWAGELAGQMLTGVAA